MITPFVRVRTYLTRNFATLGRLYLPPPFTGASVQSVKPLPLTFRHRAGVSPYTSTFVLAETCVFDKQFRGLFSCGPAPIDTRTRSCLSQTMNDHLRSRLQRYTHLLPLLHNTHDSGNVLCFVSSQRLRKLERYILTPIGAGQTLSRSYGRCIAEFLNEGSLVSLGLLDLSTCVGLRYGRLYPRA